MSTYTGNNMNGINWWQYPVYPQASYWYITTTTSTEQAVHTFNTTPETYVYALELPGHHDIEVAATTEGCFKVSSTKKGQTTQCLRKEFQLPNDARFEEGTAVYEDGVVTMTFPRFKPVAKTLKVTKR
jgi:HSP20 family molecular chaperone IbpA